MESQDRETLLLKLDELRLEHHDLDTAIMVLSERPHADQLQLRRMKKRKLQLKDYISKLESMLIPDLDA
ncbi:hypothetical protein BOW53_05740 [Solemya pervernicosa gill symbiont]|uniref:DUF465 domain-containing protein n=2 Tax=Gammaproteobacteria incertae sedis TaxID=118884 RepID=A0A1T2L7H1_9GAMM|nr:YdcH family protein [Candidatus Reidiella endopervernicosa]OOZ41023.1 hypothetical protein BOW53_05740 [Solemya pervernicosa gill symbiont]QKQ25084.1 YdcH family protein [Candidatus Reidiella endopervernicosa]